MNRRDLVLTILAAAGGRTYTPVQIQKAVFLACQEVPELIDTPSFNFQPFDYGPFDADVYTEIEFLAMGRDAVIAPSAYGSWNTYAATDAGVTRGREILLNLHPRHRDFLQKLSDWVRAQNFSSLVKSIYDAYPEMRANSIFRG